jgi:IS605 OrfB family transposase
MTLFDDETVSLSTTESRVRCDLCLPEDADGYQRQYLDSENWEVTESTLTIGSDETVSLHLGFRRPKTNAERDTAEDGTVLGVDLGVENIAVTSTARFFSGRELDHKLGEFEKTRGRLQQTGTRSAHRTLQEASGRQLRNVRERMHEVSNGLVTEALRYDCDIIVFENLTDIRENTNGAWGHKWAFRELYDQVEYKAEAAGVAVEEVGSTYTSKRCSECGFTAGKNRPTRADFQCQNCGTRANADYNAAKNIGMRYVRRGQQSSRRTGDSQLALKSGTVTPSGGFTAHPDGFEAEFMDKSYPQRARPPGQAKQGG